MTSQAAQILYIGLFLKLKPKVLTSRKRLMTSFLLNFDQKMLRFRKVTLEISEFRNFPSL